MADATVKNLKESKFLPELTFDYTIEKQEVDCIDGLNYVTEAGNILLSLNNAQVTYVYVGEDEDEEFDWNTYEWVTKTVYTGLVVLEDETGAILLDDYSLAASVKKGTVLDGELNLIAEADPYDETTISFRLPTYDEDGEAYADNAMLIMLAPTEDVKPLEVNDETVDDYMFNYNWRLAQFEGTIKVEEGYSGDDYYVNIPIMGNDYGILDALHAFGEDEYSKLHDGDEVVFVGYMYDFSLDLGWYSMSATYLSPISITVKSDDTTGISKVEADGNAKVFYNLNGQKVKADKKGLYIQDGKKVIVK